MGTETDILKTCLWWFLFDIVALEINCVISLWGFLGLFLINVHFVFGKRPLFVSVFLYLRLENVYIVCVEMQWVF